MQPNAIIWNTTARGKPDMIRLADQAYSAYHAEAVISISNKKLTRQVVHGWNGAGSPVRTHLGLVTALMRYRNAGHGPWTPAGGIRLAHRAWGSVIGPVHSGDLDPNK